MSKSQELDELNLDDWSIELIKLGTPLEVINKIDEYLDYFYSETSDDHVIRYNNGFCAVGILKIPRDHITKGINTILIFSCSYNENDGSVKIQENLALTLNEAKDHVKSLNICIEKFKNKSTEEKELW